MSSFFQNLQEQKSSDNKTKKAIKDIEQMSSIEHVLLYGLSDEMINCVCQYIADLCMSMYKNAVYRWLQTNIIINNRCKYSNTNC